MRASGRWIWQHRSTAWALVLGLALGIILWQIHSDQQRTDRVARATAAIALENRQQNEIIGNIVSQLEVETKERTTQACENNADRQDAYRNALLNLLEVSLPKDVNGQPMPIPAAQQKRLDDLKTQIHKDLPPLVCPQDQGPIVIPATSTTVAAP